MSEKGTEKRKQHEMQEGLEEMDDFLGLNEPDVLIDFECIDCGCVDPVPDFIVEECSYDLGPGEEVEMICPKCNGTMREKKSK